MSENKWAEAATSYKQASELDPSNISIMGKLGFCYSRNGQHDLAIRIFSELSRREPHIAKWPYMIGYQYYDKKDWGNAIQFFDKAVSLTRDYIKALYRNGYARIQMDDLDGAESMLLRCIDSWCNLDAEKKIAEKKRYADACFQLGKVYLTKGLTKKAEKWLREAVSQDDSDEHKRYNLGKAFLKNGKIPEALEEFQIANRLHPHLDYFQDKLAYTYLKAGKPDEAEQIYQAIPPGRRKSYIWYHYGVVLLQKGKSEAAFRVLQSASKLDYNNHHIHFHLGLAYLEMGNVLQAVRELELAAKLKLKHFGTEYKEAIEKNQIIHNQFGEIITSGGSASITESQIGVIETFNNKRGFGFLKNENDEKIFFHISAVSNPHDICLGRHAEFVRIESDKGPKASEMSVV
jgi:tetratricopeptide (TPR) repeat protein